MKKILCLLIICMMILSICVMSVSATTAPAGYVGDANCDGSIDVSDATFILRSLAKLETLNDEQTLLSDTDMDGVVSVIDATNIQRHEARLNSYGEVGYSYNYDMLENDFYSDYESGMAMAGVPVTFTINARVGSPIKSYTLYVDGVCVGDSDTNSITYTFEKAGFYDVEMRVNAFYATGFKCIQEFEVVEPYESELPQFKTLYLTGKIQWGTITYDVKGMKVTADAVGGVAPYQYRFEFERPENGDYDAPVYTYVQDYSENNVYELEVISWRDVVDEDHYGSGPNLECNLTVYIKDANGNVVSREMPIVYRWDVPVG